MSVSFSLENDTLIVAGKLDRFTLGAPACYRFPVTTGDITLDLSQVENTDTAGLAWLLKLIAHYQLKHQISIINQPQQLLVLASISNVLELLPLKNDTRS